MTAATYENAQAFSDAVLPHLLAHEAENNLMISIALRLADGTGKWGEEPPLLCAIEQGGRIVAAAVQTPPYPLQVTRMDDAALDTLIDHLRACGRSLPGVFGPQEPATAFADRWIAGTSLLIEHDKGLGAYQLRQVILPANVGGHTELATDADADLLIAWMRDFHTFIGERRENAEATVSKGIAERRFWLWNDPHPVSAALASGPTPHGMRIGGVYTPPECRGRGYASANVAALSQTLLDSGREFCYLFTDLANPTSNSIYRKIGYEQVCDFASLSFRTE